MVVIAGDTVGYHLVTKIEHEGVSASYYYVDGPGYPGRLRPGGDGANHDLPPQASHDDGEVRLQRNFVMPC